MTAPQLIRTCSIWRALEIVGDTPTLLMLESSWLGAQRFDEFLQRTELPRAVLADRLKRLTAAELFGTVAYCERPPRHAYLMSEKGRDLYWVALMLLRWESRWGSPGKIRVELTHRRCGHTMSPFPACGHCRAEIDATQVDWQEGPGLGWMVPHYSRRRQQRDCNYSASLMDEAAQLMGDRWASLIMRSIFTGVNRFEEIRRDTAMSTNILAERLAWLTRIGVIRQHPYASAPTRYEYRLRRKGVDYYPALLMLMRWGDRYYVAPEGPPLLLRHKGCGRELDPIVACSHCREPIEASDVDYRIVPPGQVEAAQ